MDETIIFGELMKTIDRIIETIGSADQNETSLDDIVTKTVPMTPEQKKEAGEIHKSVVDMKSNFLKIKKIFGEINGKVRKVSAMKNVFWSKIELDLNHFGTMRMNTKNWEIEFIQSQDELRIPRSTKSPFFRK